MVQETTKIKNKALLTLIGFLYGPLNVGGQFFSVTINCLICQPNFTFEASSTFRGQLLSLGNKIDNNEEKIEDNLDKVNQNEDDIDTNQNSIVTNQNNIVTNQNNIDQINVKLPYHKFILDINEAKIIQNEVNIKTNKENIDQINVEIADKSHP